MKTIIAGSRDFDDYALLTNFVWHTYIDEVVSGGAEGADKLGEKYAETWCLKLKRFPANWRLHGKKAGYLRNAKMADYADQLIAFWDGESKGTKHMIDLAIKKKLYVQIVKYKEVVEDSPCIINKGQKLRLESHNLDIRPFPPRE